MIAILTDGRRGSQDPGEDVEALVLTQDGKLLVHSSKIDTENKERADRYKEWKDTQEKVKSEADNKGGGRPATGFEGLIGGKKQ